MTCPFYYLFRFTDCYFIFFIGGRGRGAFFKLISCVGSFCAVVGVVTNNPIVSEMIFQ
jgi:hypothetical protein